MRISGSATVHAPRGEVWDALNDPAVLVATIPGCERLEEVGADAYAMTVSAGVGSITGIYQGEVRLGDKSHPDRFVLIASGAGTPGTLSAEVQVRLEEVEPATTAVSYDADAVIGGLVAGVGQRMIQGVAKRTAKEFFGAVDAALASGLPAVPGDGRATSGVRETSRPRIFEAPPRAAARPAGSFRQGAIVGALAALVGALVGGWLAGRRRT